MKIKIMNIKMAINLQLSTIESKYQISKQAEQEQNHRYEDHLEGYHLGGRKQNGGKGAGMKKYKMVGTK